MSDESIAEAIRRETENLEAITERIRALLERLTQRRKGPDDEEDGGSNGGD